MPLFNVTPEKENALRHRMESLGIHESDLQEQFVKGSGKGGQKINKTSSCVHLRHGPTHVEVKCQQGRSQALNRFLARRELCDRIEAMVKGEASAKKQARERIRRQKRRRSRRQQARILDDKRKQGEKKALRKPATWQED